MFLYLPIVDKVKERVLTVSNAYFIVWYLGSIDSVSRVCCECFFRAMV